MREPENTPDSNLEETPGIAALYIGSIADELSRLAKRNGLDALSFILDMARLEADQVCKGSCRTSWCSTPQPPGAGN